MIEQRLSDALRAPAPAGLLGGDLEDRWPGRLVEAAVLIAITDCARPGVILTVRRDDLRTHAGQVAFPGGRIDPGEDAMAAALREAWEELALPPSGVRLVGALEPYATVTDYLVTPVVGVISPNPNLIPHDAEVADWFEAPLDHLLDPANRQRRSVVFAGQERHYYEIRWNDRMIWGATAAMLVNLAARLGSR